MDVALTPRSLGPWQVERLLHDGSRGRLYAVRHTRSGQRAVARLMAAGPEGAPTHVRHPRLVAVLDVVPGAMVLEDAPGTDLHRVIELRRKAGAPFAVAAAVRLATDVAAAFARLVEADVPVGSCDAGDVLVDAEGRARVVALRRPAEPARLVAALLYDMLTLAGPAADATPPLRKLNPRVPEPLARLVDDATTGRLTDLDDLRRRLERLPAAPPAAPRAAGSERLKWFRDSVHGDMAFTADEVALIDTPQFQRLRAVRQLGATCLVYHDAIHTRFSHSLGAAHVARRILAAIDERGDVRLAPDERRAAVAHALLHDVTHVPFGHTLEDERAVFERHDRNRGRVQRLVVDSELGDALRGQGLADVLAPLLLKGGQGDAPPWVRDVVEAPVSCDVMDYVRRDALFCGLPITYDMRILSLMTLVEVDGRPRLALDLRARRLKRYDGLSEVVNLVRSRYLLWERVYAHHAKVRAGAMLSKAVELALRGDAPLREEELESLGDETLLGHLEHDARFAASPHAPWIQRLLRAYRERNLYKSCYVVQYPEGRTAAELDAIHGLVQKYHRDVPAREALEAEIARAAGIAAEDVIVYCPARGMASQRPDVPVLLGGDAPVNLADVHDPEIETLRANHRRLWTFYVLAHPEHRDRRDRIGDACEALLGRRNEVRDVLRGQLSLPLR